MSRDGFAKGFKVDALLRMPLSTDVGTLRSFKGSLQFYTKFVLPYLSTTTKPLQPERANNINETKRNKKLLKG